MSSYKPDRLQKIALGLMGIMVMLTFMLANLHALFWQSSGWLVGAVLPSVVVELTNEERQELAAGPLRRNATLDTAAQRKAEHMAENGYFAHYAPDGTSPWYWFDDVGYVYAHAGENLAIHFTDSDEVVKAWMNSPTHRANIIDRKFTEIGVGTARGRFDGHRTVYVVQLFGTPAYIPPTSVRNDTVANALAVNPEPVSSVEEVVDETPDTVAVEITQDTAVIPEEEQVTITERSVPQSALVANEFVTTMSNVTDQVIVENPEPETAAPVVYAKNNYSFTQSLMATSSGLAAKVIPQDTLAQTQLSFLSLATQPNTMLQVAYVLLALAVFMLLILSFVDELKHAHPIQMAYSLALLVAMGSLYWLHASLTEGAIVV